MPIDLAAYKVFIASPGGLDAERRAFREVLQEYNEQDANSRKIHFIPVGWELTLGGMGRPQELINNDLKQCDYCLVVLHNKLGSPPCPTTATTYTSGTEEEYHIAKSSISDAALPMKDVVVFFKAVAPAQLADPGEALKKVLSFRRECEEKKEFLFEQFDEIEAFKSRLRSFLAKWVRDHENRSSPRGHAPQPTPGPPQSSDSGGATHRTLVHENVVTPPGKSDGRPERPRAERRGGGAWIKKTVASVQEQGQGQPRETVSEPDSSQLTTNEWVAQAERFTRIGKLLDAETAYASAIARGDDPSAFLAYAEFLFQQGRTRQAMTTAHRSLTLAQSFGDRVSEAVALTRLGSWYGLSGKLDEAQQLLRKSLLVNEQLARLEGMAAASHSLGVIARTRGEHGEAERLLREAVAAYRASLTVRTREALPQDWALTQNNLAIALTNQASASEGPERARLLGEAVDAHRAALTIRTREALPLDWATSQHNLANTLRHQALASDGPERARLLGEAVGAYRAALTVRTREALPRQWATTQNNLAIALADQAEATPGQRCELLREAIACGKAALMVRTREHFPQHRRGTSNNLAIDRRAYEEGGCAREVAFDDIAPAR